MAIHENPKSKSPQIKVNKSKSPFGNYTGTGVRNRVGKMREGSVGVIPANKKQLKTPPKKLA
jgi:hypothetical protein